MKKSQLQQKEHIAFEGKKFTIEWYFDSKGKSIALEYFDSLDDDEQMRLLSLFEVMGNVGEIKNKTKFRYEDDMIYAFKPQPHRFLCFFFTARKIIVTNAFHKKTDKLPTNEKKRALNIKDDYEVRIKRGDYYE
jgi:phage-related protein